MREAEATPGGQKEEVAQSGPNATGLWGLGPESFRDIFYWCIIDLQYCVSFRCIAKQFSYIYFFSGYFLL